MLSDEEILDAIKDVCDFEPEHVDRMRVPSLRIGRAIAKLAERKALHDAYIAVSLSINVATADRSIRALIEQSEKSGG